MVRSVAHSPQPQEYTHHTMAYSHQSQCSVNSVQSIVEPVTPPPGKPMAGGSGASGKRGMHHGKSRSLDLGVGASSASANGTSAIASPGNLPLISEALAGLEPMSFSHRAGNPRPTGNSSAGNATAVGEGVGAVGESVAGNHSRDVGEGVSGNHSRGSKGNASRSNKHSRGKGRNRQGGNGRRSASSSSSSGSTAVEIDTAISAEISATPLADLDYVKLATDQFGCRFLQKKLEAGPRESCQVRDLMFDQIKPYFINLILDPFGNYLVQKLCDYLTSDQRTQLIDTIYPHVFKISINQYGTRSLQKIIDSVDSEVQTTRIVQGFSPPYTSIDQIVTLINDLNGNHVIQKCIFKFPASQFGFIIDAIVDRNNIVAISTHKHGCCVLQKLLSVCTLQQIFDISVKIVQCIQGLINDQFGNYIIQFLLDIRELDFFVLPEIFNKLSGDLCQLSCLKFSSNVIEKFIKKLFGVVIAAVKGEAAPNMTDTVMNNIMNILLTIIDIFTMKLNILIRDNYGNYALQTLLDAKHYAVMLEYPGNDYIRNNNPKFANFSHDFTERVQTLVCMTKDLLPSIKTTSYAKKIKLKVKGYSDICGVELGDARSTVAPAPQVSAGTTPPPMGGLTPTSSVTLEVNGQPRTNLRQQHQQHQQQHQRHVSLPANAYHRRSSSSVMPGASATFMTLNTTSPQQLSGIQTSINSMMGSQNSSPLSITQSQQMDLLNAASSSFMPMPMPMTMPAVGSSRGLSTQNGLGFADEFDLARPLANLSLNASMPAQSMFFSNDNNSSAASTNNQRNVSTSSSSSNILHNNYSSASSSTLNSSIPNNFMTTPNLMNTSSIAYNPSDRTTSSTFNDFKNVALQPQQRIVSNPYAGNQNLGYEMMAGAAPGQTSSTSSATSPQFYSNSVANSTMVSGMNSIPQANGQDTLNNSFGFY